jgi:antitoxin VapB
MAFHVRDPETDALVRKLAKRKGVGITEAIREAAARELKREEKKLSLWERTADIRAELNANPDPDFKADKDFYDWLSGEEDVEDVR